MVPRVLTMANRNKTPTADDVELSLTGVELTDPDADGGFHVHLPDRECCGIVWPKHWWFWRARWGWDSCRSSKRRTEGVSRTKAEAVRTLIEMANDQANS